MAAIKSPEIKTAVAAKPIFERKCIVPIFYKNTQ
jgi:hypothetical protein